MIEKNIPEMFVQRAKQYKNSVAIKYKSNGVYCDITWDDLLNKVVALSLSLFSLGIRKDDKVAIIAESSPEWVFTDLAVLSLGAITVPIFPTYPKRETEYIINHSETRFIVISDEKQWLKISSLVDKNKDTLRVMSFRPIQTDFPFFLLSQMIAKQSAMSTVLYNQFTGRIRRINGDDLASIIYTSGTTGPPKGVMLSHNNFLSNCIACSKAISIKRGDLALSVLPLSHVFERLAGYYLYLYFGVTIAYAESLQTLHNDFVQLRPHVAMIVPRIFEKYYHKIMGNISSAKPFKRMIMEWAIGVGKKKYILEIKKLKIPFLIRVAFFFANLLVYRKIKSLFGGKIRFFISGGAKLSKDIARFFYAANILILEGYGLTETSPVVSVNRFANNKFGTVGIPLDGISVKIETDGEIVIKGPNVMQGYFKDEAATSATVKEGWLYTGDIGVLDENGFLKITDRKKDIIVTSGGKNIAPQNIENILKANQFINQAFVCGDGEKYLSALIVPDFEQLSQYAMHHGITFSNFNELVTCSAVNDHYKRLIADINTDFADHEKIKKITLLSDEFSMERGELTPTLKLKRNVVFAHYKNLICDMYRR
jgi:long-chain acyl-CoA synthetase